MAKGSSASRIGTIVVCIPLLIGAWFVAPIFLPMWRWLNLDVPALAKRSGKSEAQLRQIYDVQVRFHPRADGDPAPYQLISMSPAWGDTDGNRDEDHLLTRIVLLSERSGTPPSALMLGSQSWRDCYFRAKAMRLPALAAGTVPKRPVLLYVGGSLEKLSVGEAISINDELGTRAWDNDDEDVDDGFSVAK